MVPLPVPGRIFALLLFLLPLPAHADTLVDNVDGISVDAKGAITRFTGLVIGADGHIAKVLARGEARPATADNRIDGKGRTALPGMIDSHLRLMDLGFSALALDLSNARSLRDVQLKLGAYAATHPTQAWIVGRGWDSRLWDRPDLPSAADLDAVVADRPVWLVSADGQSGWANALALKAAGVTETTANPVGGKVLRAGTTRESSGVLTGAARALVDQLIPPPRGEDRDRALAKAQTLLLAQGVTAVADMGTTIEDWQAYRRAGDAGTLRLRIMAYAEGVQALELIAGPAPTPWLYDDRLRLNGVVLRIDGGLPERAALLKAPYADDAKTSGAALLDGSQFSALMHRAASGGFEVALEAHGDAAFDRALDGIEALGDDSNASRRWRIEGAEVTDPADAGRAGKARIVVATAPQAQPAGQAMVEARLGPDRLGGAFAWKSLEDGGVVLSFGSFAPGQPPAPFAAITAAFTRIGPDGEPFGGWQPQQRLGREAALSAATAGGAWAGLAETRFGSLAPGQRADFILVDRDPLLASPDELRATRVIETWVGGQRVYQATELPLAIPRHDDER